MSKHTLDSDPSWAVAMTPMARGCALAVILVLTISVGIVHAIHGLKLLSIYLAFLVYVLILALPFVTFRPTLGWFHPLVITVLWSGFVEDVLPRLSIYANGLEYHDAVPGASHATLNTIVIEGLLLTAVGFLSLYVGYLIPRNPRVPHIRLQAPRSIHAKMFLIAAISVTAFLVLSVKAGGIEQLILQRGIPVDLRVATNIGGHWTFLVRVLTPACLVWLSLDPEIWRRFIFVGLFALSLLLNFAATGSRGSTIMPLIAAVVIHSMRYHIFPYGKAIAIGIVGLASVGVLAEFRDKSSRVQDLAEMQLDNGFLDGIAQGAKVFVAREGTTSGLYGILARVPREVGLLYGWSYLSIPAAPIPRSLWRDKPQAGGVLTARYIFGHQSTAFPPGAIGEAYWNFDIPGVIGIMFLFGVVLRCCALLYVANRGERWSTVLYVYTLFYLRPDSESFYHWFQAIVPAVFSLIFFCGFPRERGDRRQQ